LSKRFNHQPRIVAVCVVAAQPASRSISMSFIERNGARVIHIHLKPELFRIPFQGDFLGSLHQQGAETQSTAAVSHV
jgi:hypothetical protein